MKAQEVIDRVQKIRELSYYADDEAHVLEDALYLDVLKAIAGGARGSRKLAQEAIRADLIEFARWCA